MGMNPSLGIPETAFFASSPEEIPAACITGPAHGKAWVLNHAKTRREAAGATFWQRRDRREPFTQELFTRGSADQGMRSNPRVRRREARDPQAGELRQAACQHAVVADGMNAVLSTHAPAFFVSTNEPWDDGSC